jgi:hypothetical protein
MPIQIPHRGCALSGRQVRGTPALSPVRQTLLSSGQLRGSRCDEVAGHRCLVAPRFLPNRNDLDTPVHCTSCAMRSSAGSAGSSATGCGHPLQKTRIRYEATVHIAAINESLPWHL